MGIDYSNAKIMMYALQSLGFYAEIANNEEKSISSYGNELHGPVLLTNANEIECLTLWDDEYIDENQFHEKYDPVSENILLRLAADDWCFPPYVHEKTKYTNGKMNAPPYKPATIHCVFLGNEFVDLIINQPVKYNSDEIICFYSKGDYPQFSNFYPIEIKREASRGDGIIQVDKWASVEHYFQYQKALEFNPGGRAIKEMSNELSCKEIKALGKTVQNFAPAVWNIRRRFHMRDAVAMKFRQNAQLREMLLATGDALLAEASPRDTFWGIGYSGSNPKAHDPSQWRGKNVLGNMLMYLRDEMREEDINAAPPNL